jgi:hypothetical protein
MDTLTIGKLHSRYRLPAWAAPQRERLDRVLDAAIDDYLDLALARAGVPTDEEVCIRSIRSVAKMRLSNPDSALAAALSLAIADAVRQAVADLSFDIVRYRSRSHALLDVVAAATKGELGRAWAWQQMGLWRASQHIGRAGAIAEAMRALCSEPRAAVPVLAALTRLSDHAEAFAALLDHAGSDRWVALARAVLGTAVPRVAVPSAIPALPAEEDSKTVDPQMRATADRILARSLIAGSTLPLLKVRPVGPAVTTALAVLAIAEVEPAGLCGRSERNAVLVATAAAALRARAAAQKQSPGPATPAARLRIGQAPRADPLHERAPVPTPTPSSMTRTVPVREVSLPEECPLPDSRMRGTTCAGGLLLFVRLAGRLGLPDHLCADLPGRPLRLALHRLAMMLAPVQADDAAALAFAGLGPGSVPPSDTDEPFADDDNGVIVAARDRLIAALREALARAPGAEGFLTLDDRELSAFVCQRKAEVIADPGWLDIRFSLDDVSIDIRASGLDCDPGWVPWLGIVMRFVYA